MRLYSWDQDVPVIGWIDYQPRCLGFPLALPLIRWRGSRTPFEGKGSRTSYRHSIPARILTGEDRLGDSLASDAIDAMELWLAISSPGELWPEADGATRPLLRLRSACDDRA